jgi:hypothetical protein
MDKNPALFNSSDYVRIVNESDEVIPGRYDGQDYEFRIGEAVDVRVAVAHHIFGFMGDEAARLRAFLRLGWMQTNTDLKSAKKKLEKIKFIEVPNLIDFEPRRTGRGGPLADGGTAGAAGTGATVLSAPTDPLDEDDEELSEKL